MDHRKGIQSIRTPVVSYSEISVASQSDVHNETGAAGSKQKSDVFSEIVWKCRITIIIIIISHLIISLYVHMCD